MMKITAVIVFCIALILWVTFFFDKKILMEETKITVTSHKEISKNQERTPRIERFPRDVKISQKNVSQISTNDKWWLSAGGYVYFEDGTGHTLIGDLSPNDPRHVHYKQSGKSSVEYGRRPQNIFRLVHRGLWQDYDQQTYFKIDYYSDTDDMQRNKSNGVFHFNRYIDSDNVYYTGLRVDGNVVIKKKKNGTYHTLFIEPYSTEKFNKDQNRNLLPKNEWFGLKSTLRNIDDRSVEISVFVDWDNDGIWELLGSAVDGGRKYGGDAFRDASHTGIRTDFMDAHFSKYEISEKPNTPM